MTSAFNEIKAKAFEYFDAVHERNLKAIKDAHDHRDALLEAKEALNQAPVTAAQKALDDQRKAIQEWRLRQAVASASSPEEYRDAVLALQDFLAQKHIDEMQAQVDDANEILEKKKKANDDQEQARIDAENDRYEKQKKDFQRNLTALEAYLKNHPEAWRRTQNEILALLNEYGISYKNAGNLLGSDFATGLRDQVKAAAAAGTALANAAGTAIQSRATQIAAAASAAAAVAAAATAAGYGAVGGGNGQGNQPRMMGGPVYAGQPTWVGEAGKEMFVPQTNGYVLNHADSLRAMSNLQPAAAPVSLDAIRRATERPEAPTGNAMVDVTASRASEGVSGGKTTVIFQVGERVFGEMADISLYQQRAMRERNSVTKVGASRR
jgi:DNA-binding ferritin-like protein (Dps family)